MMDKQTFYKKECVSGGGGWTQKELKDICTFFKLKTSGTKEILCDRIKTFFIEEIRIFKKETIDFMIDWVFFPRYVKNIYHSYKTVGIESDLQKSVENKEYVMYRGLVWRSDNKYWLSHFANSFGTRKMFSSGDYLNLKIENSSSWSVDKQVALNFIHSEKNNFSILLKLTTNSKNVLVDVENFYKIIEKYLQKTKILQKNPKLLKSIEFLQKTAGKENLMTIEQEIVLKPGNYKVKIEELFLDSLNIKSMEEWGKEVYT